MTNENDSPDQIEREIERDREALRHKLEDLQDELSLEGISRRLTGTLREHGSEWAQSANMAARENPVALALTGVGLAWMIFGRGYDPSHKARQSFAAWKQDDHDNDVPPRRVPAPPPAARPAAITPPAPPASRPFSASRMPSWANSDHHSSSDQGNSMTDKLKDRAQSLRDRLSEGTEGLGEEARRRVEDARRKALQASDKASRHFNSSSRQVSESYNAEPLLYGAAALLLGAGLGAVLPRTSREDELMGHYRDQLFDEAEAIYQDEKSKIQSAVSAGLEEAKSAASDVASAAKNELSKDGSTSDRSTSGSSTSGTQL
ncbi:DUF3618 domain-containing protein [Paracoccus sp. (in: a-proteobacteria)]|uniref:DUF3618 domain-containing protein n=1 Tax=Paracoccus sp. TaxID=267 RepID=UPI00396CFC6F